MCVRGRCAAALPVLPLLASPPCAAIAPCRPRRRASLATDTVTRAPAPGPAPAGVGSPGCGGVPRGAGVSPRGAAAAAGPRSERRVLLGSDRGCGDSDRSATRCIVSSGVLCSLSYAFACGRWWRDFFFIFVQRAERFPRFSQLETCEVFKANALGAVSSHGAASFPSGCRCQLRPLHPGDAALAARCPLLCPAGLCPGCLPKTTPTSCCFALLASPPGTLERIAAGFSAVPRISHSSCGCIAHSSSSGSAGSISSPPRARQHHLPVPGISPCPHPLLHAPVPSVSPAARRDVSDAGAVLRYGLSSCPQAGGCDQAALALQFSSHSKSGALPIQIQLRKETEAPGALWIMPQYLRTLGICSGACRK